MTLRIVLIATLALAAAILLVGAITQQADPGFADAATALTFITGAAVGIERMIETFWTVIGGIKGSTGR